MSQWLILHTDSLKPKTNFQKKLLPNIHRTPASNGNTDIELITAFTIKLKEHIVKELISRDVQHTSLQAVISVAEHFEMHLPSLALTQPAEGRADLSNWEPVAHYSGTLPRGPTRPQSKTLEDLVDITIILN